MDCLKVYFLDTFFRPFFLNILLFPGTSHGDLFHYINGRSPVNILDTVVGCIMISSSALQSWVGLGLLLRFLNNIFFKR